MAKKLSLQELLDEVADLINFKDHTLTQLNHSAYRFFRNIILYRERNTAGESKELDSLAKTLRDFIAEMNVRVPETIRKINLDKEISYESKASHKAAILSTKGVNEVLGLLEAIALEITRDENYAENSNSQQELKAFVDKAKELSRETRDFIVSLQKGVDELPPAALYTVEGHIIGVALILVYAFLVSFNLSFIRLSQDDYETAVGLPKAWNYWTDLLLPLLSVPFYILLHYISTRVNMKVSFMLSIALLITGNALYYAALHGVKQFVGFNVDPKDRVKLSAAAVASTFLGYSLGYFLSLTTLDYSGEFLTFETNGQNIGGLFIGGAWVIVYFFAAVLFVNPDKNYRSLGHEKIYIQGLVIVSYVLQFVVLQTFVSNHAVPTFVHPWDDGKFFIFLGVFCLMAVPVHVIIFISSYFTTDKFLIASAKTLLIVAGLVQFVMYYSRNSQEFWYVIGSLMIVVGVNIGIAVSFAMLAGNIKNHRIGLFSGVLEVTGLVFGNFIASYASYLKYIQAGIIVVVAINFALDISMYKEFNPLKSRTVVEASKKNN
jgi:hypothetical protein